MIERNLSAYVADLRAQVPPMLFHQSLTYEPSQPNEEWHRWIFNVFGQSSRRVDIRFLNDVGWIDTSLQTWIHPQRDHAAQSGPMIAHETLPCLAVSSNRLFDERWRVVVTSALITHRLYHRDLVSRLDAPGGKLPVCVKNVAGDLEMGTIRPRGRRALPHLASASARPPIK